MPSEPVLQFLEQAERSGLFEHSPAREELAQLTSDDALTTDQAAARLVEKKLLTSFQAELLIQGKAEECVIAGRYQVLAELGKGGMGTVYRARDSKLDRTVAIKVLPAGRLNDFDAVARFQREAKALARLSHPNIIQAHDSGEDRGRHFLVMECVDGVTLQQVLRQHGALAPTLAADVIHQAALGLQHAHEKSLIHRDIKPANLLVSGLTPPHVTDGRSLAMTVSLQETPGPPRLSAGAAMVKILDLGLARFLQDQIGDSNITREGSGMGTPDYMAPEQFRDAHHADARTDIYGLGCTLYHLIAGQVPFPGSSYAEKAEAHAKKEAIPLEERCPEAPAGLAYVVAKMMAKHPSERYQSAAEVAEALAPYIAGCSHSLINLRQTGGWPPGQVTMLAPSRGRPLLRWGVRLGTTALLLVLLVFAWPTLFPGEPQVLPGPPPPEVKPPAPGPIVKNSGPEKKKPDEPPPKPKIVTIENGLTVAQDGTGQYRTINEALKHIKPGQTIRVLDDAVYKEQVQLRDRFRFEGITLEAPRNAILDADAGAKIMLLVFNVPRVTTQGFHFRLAHQGLTGFGVGGTSPGAVFENLTCTAQTYTKTTGGTIDSMALKATDDPVIIRNCRFRAIGNGLELVGYNFASKLAQPCKRFLIHGNNFEDCAVGAWLLGHFEEAAIVGNRFWGWHEAAIRLDQLGKESRQILIANNSAIGEHQCVEIVSPPSSAKDVVVRNNVMLADKGLDIACAGSNGKPLAGWRIEQNWRQVRRPAPDSSEAKNWVDSPNDQFNDKHSLVTLNSTDAQFLRPKANSPLAKVDAGSDLPSWAGAVPPEGAQPWDWRWSWDAFANQLFTVSKDQKTGGRFRTMAAALDQIRPGHTIRVLDDSTYAEALLLNRPGTQTGITIEAPRRATILFPATKLGIFVANVPRLTLRGFRLRHEGPINYMIGVTGKSQGLHLDELDLKLDLPQSGAITLEGIDPTGELCIVENCTIKGGRSGLRVSGYLDYATPLPCGNIALRNNTVLDSENGILALGLVKKLHVVGNRVAYSSLSGIQLENLLAGTEQILFANNTVLECKTAFRLWDRGDKRDLGRGITLANNLFLGSNGPDAVFLDSGGTTADLKGPGEGQALLKLWTWQNNWRETTPPKGLDALSKGWIPIANADTRHDTIEVQSRNPGQADFLKPAKDSLLANAGAGGDLPSYVGAVPPEDVPAWDWMKTWKARQR